MSDKKTVLSTDDLAPRPRAVNEAAANQITGGSSAPVITDPRRHDAMLTPTKPPPPVVPASGKKP